MPEPNDRFFFYVALDMPEGAILPEKAKQLKKRVREKGDKAGGGGGGGGGEEKKKSKDTGLFPF